MDGWVDYAYMDGWIKYADMYVFCQKDKALIMETVRRITAALADDSYGWNGEGDYWKLNGLTIDLFAKAMDCVKYDTLCIETKIQKLMFYAFLHCYCKPSDIVGQPSSLLSLYSAKTK